MAENTIAYILQEFSCSLTRTCKEKNCSLQLDNVNPTATAIIHGTKYQKNEKFTKKLCDRLVFCMYHGLVLVAVELKGGNKINMSQAIEQIQNGLSVAAGILKNVSVAEWLPILMFSGHIGPHEIRLLRNKSVEFQGERKIVVKRPCNSKLSAILAIG